MQELGVECHAVQGEALCRVVVYPGKIRRRGVELMSAIREKKVCQITTFEAEYRSPF